MTAEVLVVAPGDGPIWRQIEHGIRRMIVMRALRPGEAVPSIRKLALRVGVTPATVERAYRRLIASGVLVTRRGRGTFVSDVAAPQMSERDKVLQESATSFAALAREIGAPLDEAAGELRQAYGRLPDSESADA